MSIVTTYVCDVSGKSGTDRTEFIDVAIEAYRYRSPSGYRFKQNNNASKLVHIDIARRLNLLDEDKENPVPEITLESRLSALVGEMVVAYVDDAVSDAMSNYRNN